jgi:hypothetical protein
MKVFVVHPQNQMGKGWTSKYETLHDAEVSVRAIKEANSYLSTEYQFHGWVTEWNGHSLPDGSKVTESAEAVLTF